MKIELRYVSIFPADTLIDCYDNSNRPFARIEEDELFEIMTDKQIERFHAGEYVFNLPKGEIIDKCKTYFGVSGIGF